LWHFDSIEPSQVNSLASKNNSGVIKVINVNSIEQCVNASQWEWLNLVNNTIHCGEGHSRAMDCNSQKCLKCLNYFDVCVCFPCSNNVVALFSHFYSITGHNLVW
jgi:hypothetical protein